MTNESTEISRDHMFSNKTYDRLKFIAQVALPAIGTLYFALSGIWSLPDPDKVVATIMVVDTFLGILLHIGTASYNNSEAKFDGSIDVETDKTGKQTFSLNLNDDPEKIPEATQITFKVNPPK